MLNENPKNEIAYKLTDKYEVKIYEAINSMSISKCSKIEVKEVLKTCLQLSGTQTPAMDDFDFIVDFVMDNYGIFLKYFRNAIFEGFLRVGEIPHPLEMSVKQWRFSYRSPLNLSSRMRCADRIASWV